MLITLATSILLSWAAAQPVLEPPRAVRLSHRSVSPGLERRGFELDAENRFVDNSYWIEMKVGTPEQTVSAQLQSIDPRLMLFGRPGYGGDDPWARDPGFIHNKSSTFQDPSGNFTNGDSESERMFVTVTDTVTVGNDTRENTPFQYTSGRVANDQVFGFGFPTVNNTQASFWHTASASWADKRVGLFLSRHRDEPKEVDTNAKGQGFMDSEVMVGGVNEKKFTGEIASHPFTPDESGAWLIPLEGITVNGKAVDLSAASNGSSGSNSSSQPRAGVSFYDTKTYLPDAIVKQIYANIPGAKLVPPKGNPNNASYDFPCENTLGIDVRFTIGGREYAMKAVDMVVGINENNVYGDGHVIGQTPKNGSCIGAFRALLNERDPWRIGTSFLKNVYTVLDFETPAVGFAQVAEDAQPDAKGRNLSSASRASVSLLAVVAAAAVCLL